MVHNFVLGMPAVFQTLPISRDELQQTQDYLSISTFIRWSLLIILLKDYYSIEKFKYCFNDKKLIQEL